MIHRLSLHNVGPAPDLTLPDLAPRLNLIAGDNGLGKSFLLETAWWALTRTWHESPAIPSAPDARIEFTFDAKSKKTRGNCPWDSKGQRWKRKQGRPPNPGLVLYARVDGSFSAWDPYRNYRLYSRTDGGQSESPHAYQLSSRAVMEGLRRDVTVGGQPHTEVLCRGLIDDWREWQATGSPRFELLRNVLAHIGPDAEPIVPGDPVRPSLDDVRSIPTVRMPYGQDVPITYAPAGVRRMAKLAYLLTWSISEHQEEARRQGEPPSNHIVVLIDEPETHLHPRWQRTLMPALVRALEESLDEGAKVQLLVATHSPLILASVEPLFDVKKDALWKLDLDNGEVVLERDVWHKRGDVNRWLLSDVFDLRGSRNPEAERAIAHAAAVMGDPSSSPTAVEDAGRRLAEQLPENDPVYVRWRFYVDQRP